ncbi:MAG: hypothetical protein A3H95_11220 [Acidobacteria bacterium RIFCSPLOWO2_02_FULL_64_15]|nr:MAG: hypothetical protein A3H95_11220 [Acidobacteria bacterium RIFCSPLOWO2_02_FULL_64_15]
MIRAIESGRLTELRLDLARRYFRFLAIEQWVDRWCRANRELATRVGLTNGTSGRGGEQKGSGRRALPPFAPKL